MRRTRGKPLPPPPPPPPGPLNDDPSSDEGGSSPGTPREPAPAKKKNKRKTQTAQKDVDEFWDKFHNKFPGKAYTLLPDNLYAKRQAAARARSGDVSRARTENAQVSYDEAVAVCQAKVNKIVEQCRRVNQKYTDSHFDIEMDLADGRGDCLKRLYEMVSKCQPGSVKRIREIFDKPEFYVNASPANDIRQGNDGNCWFLAAICAILHDKEAINRICVARDTAVGVYGFVFYRDGEWYSEVIDDKLYLTKADFNDLKKEERDAWNDLTRDNPEKDWREQMQKGSGALYFAQCKDPQETWLPLLEKAYAKAHGDYSSLDGGHMGEALEDLTGGVTSEISTSDILDLDKFWTDEMLKVNDEFFFGCTAGMLSMGFESRGIQYRHAYSIMEAREVDGKRLMKLRNPWGKVEWDGPWSDGSEEWTPEWMIKLNHRFGDDGVFWISYEDFLRMFTNLDRTRRFGSEWRQTQLWTSLNIPWSVDYLDTSFKITIAKKTSVVIVLSQLDERFWYGLGGQYSFRLQFRLHKKGDVDYIVRSRNNCHMRRSVNAELEDIEPGEYSVRMKIVAKRSPVGNVEEILPFAVRVKRDKLLKVGLQYDLAHAKGHFKERESEKTEREKRQTEADRVADNQKHRLFRKRCKLRLLRREEREYRQKAKEKEREAIRNGEVIVAREIPACVNGATEDPNVAAAEQTSKDEAAFEKDDPTNDALPKPEETAVVIDDANAEPPGADKPLSKDDTPLPNGDAAIPLEPVDSETVPNKSEPAAVTAGPSEELQPDEDEAATTKPLSRRQSSMRSIQPRPQAKRLTLSDVSDSEASWDSDVDGSFRSDGAPTPESQPPPPPQDKVKKKNKGDDESEVEEYEADPWNAVVVLGLRVYSRDTAPEDVRLEVTQEGSDKEKELDLDDAAHDATQELENRAGDEGRAGAAVNGIAVDGAAMNGAVVHGAAVNGTAVDGATEVDAGATAEVKIDAGVASEANGDAAAAQEANSNAGVAVVVKEAPADAAGDARAGEPEFKEDSKQG